VAGNEHVECINVALGRLDDEIAILHFSKDQILTPLLKTGHPVRKLAARNLFFCGMARDTLRFA
jgi:hypothetical protein